MKRMQLLSLMLLAAFFALQGISYAEMPALVKVDNSVKESLKATEAKTEEELEEGEEAVEGAIEKAKPEEMIPAPATSEVVDALNAEGKKI